MWHQVDRGDIDKARKSLGYRLGHLLIQQQEEMKTLRAKHAVELHVLEAKQAELNGLEAMIERFADEFQAAPQTEATDAPDGTLQQPDETQNPVPVPADMTLPGRLAVQYVAPGFRPLRRFAA